MHLHDLKHLIAVIVLIACVTDSYCLVDSSTSYYLNEVADFDDIVELDNEKDKVNFEEQSAKNPDFSAPEEEGPDPLSIRFIEPSSRVKTDVRGVQNKPPPYLVQSTHHSAEQYKDSLGQPGQPKGRLNIFESPLIYEVQDEIPQQGYFLVKQKKSEDQQINKISEKSIHDDNNYNGGDQIYHSMGNSKDVNHDMERQENYIDQKINQPSKTGIISGSGSDKFCNQFFEMFHQIPQIVKQLSDSKEPQIRNNNWKSIKCLIREQHPDFTKTGILDRPESKSCYQKFMRRRKRHSTYINFRNRKKKYNNNLAKRNAPNDPRYKNIIDFIIKNKSFRNNYTYVPVLFVTVKNIDLNQLITSEGSLVTDKSTTGSSTQQTLSSVIKSTNMSSTNSMSISSNTLSSVNNTVITNNTESARPLNVSLPISQVSTSIVHPASSALEGTATVSTVLPIERKENNLTEELNFRIPKLRQSLRDIMDIMGDDGPPKRMKKEVHAITEISKVTDDTSIRFSQPNHSTTNSPSSNTTVPTTTILNPTVNSGSVDPANITSDHIPFPSESHFNVTISAGVNDFNKFDKLVLDISSLGPIKTNVENDTLSTTEISTIMTSKLPPDGKVMPGVLIFPINSETQNNNKSKRGVQEDEYSAENKAGINTYLTIEEPDLIANRKYIDFNPLPKMKKDIPNDCQDETEEMLNVLKSLNMKVPDEIDNIKDKYGSDVTISSSNIVTSAPETARITQISTENRIIDFNPLTNVNISSLMEANPKNLMKPVANNNKIQSFTLLNHETTIDEDAWCATSFGTENNINTSTIIPASTIVPSITTITETSSTTVPTTVSESSTTSSTSSSSHLTTTITDLEKETHNPLVRQIGSAEKLKKLETDLKLVNEVQNILNGMNSPKHDMKKRELPSYQPNCSTENDPIFELNFKVVSSSPEVNKEKEINELGKILQWKAKTDKCRRRRLSKSKRKRKKKKRRKPKPHRFLGQRTQN